MQVPILRHGDYLIASIQSALTDSDLLSLRQSLVQQVGSARARAVIVDVTALDVLDSFASRTLQDLAQMIRLRGAETIVVGVQAEVAFSMAQLGVVLEGVETRLDLEEALAYLAAKTAPARHTRER
jgi:rsbT antagonist protein RsbS